MRRARWALVPFTLLAIPGVVAGWALEQIARLGDPAETPFTDERDDS